MKRNKRVEILLTEEEDKRFEEMAKKIKIPKGRLIRNLALIGLEDAELFHKLGLFEIAKLIEKIKEKAQSTKNPKLANWYQNTTKFWEYFLKES